jgi:hypothetical protein
MMGTVLTVMGVGLAVLVGGTLVLAATRPDEFTVQRRTLIRAAPEKIYGLVEDFRRWGAWSPYETLDPAMARTYEGAEAGLGAVYAWDGNSKAGQGRMEIKEARPGARLVIALDFLKPFKTSNTALFTFEPAPGGTQVTWAMMGRYPLMAKVMGLFFNMDRMVGADFETGLANLKAQAET